MDSSDRKPSQTVALYKSRPPSRAPLLLAETLETSQELGVARRRRRRRRPHISGAKMKLIAAYLLAVLGGNTTPSAEDLKSILESVGAEIDDDRVEFLLSEVKGKDITELIAAGREKFASVPSGGGAIAVAAAAAPAAGGAGAAPEPEAKKEEKVEEKEESDDDMGFSLFD